MSDHSSKIEQYLEAKNAKFRGVLCRVGIPEGSNFLKVISEAMALHLEETVRYQGFGDL